MTSPSIAEPILPQEDHLEIQLQRRLGSRIHDLRILARPGGIILKGRAATYHAKQIAQHAAMEITDRPILANEIEVY